MKSIFLSAFITLLGNYFVYTQPLQGKFFNCEYLEITTNLFDQDPTIYNDKIRPVDKMDIYNLNERNNYKIPSKMFVRTRINNMGYLYNQNIQPHLEVIGSIQLCFSKSKNCMHLSSPITTKEFSVYKNILIGKDYFPNRLRTFNDVIYEFVFPIDLNELIKVNSNDNVFDRSYLAYLVFNTYVVSNTGEKCEFKSFKFVCP